MKSPKVFISHASEDKERFVINFATKLREKGVDAWLDKWEILIGDSLVDKIFESGVEPADVMIVVLSKHSVKKPWVKEEINNGFIKKIEGKLRLMPIIIDDCEVPSCLKDTVHKKIVDISSYDIELNEILNAIFGINQKPTLGNLPKYAQSNINFMYGYSSIDNIVFKATCDIAFRKSNKLVNWDDLEKECNKYDISREQLVESLEILHEDYYIKLEYRLGSGIPYFLTIQDSSFEEYAISYIKDYKKRYKKIAYYIINNKNITSASIMDALGESKFIVDHVLIDLRNQGLVDIAIATPYIHILRFSAKLKRNLETGEF